MSLDLAFALFNYFPFGGLQKDMLAIARQCVARGHRVTIYTGSWQGERPDDCAVVELPVRGLTNHGRDAAFVQRLQEWLQSLPTPPLRVGFNKMPGLDVYYAADSCFAAKAAERGWWYRRSPRARHYLAMEQAVFAPPANTHILMISAPEQAVYQRFYGTPGERLQLLPPGIRRDRMMPADYAGRRTAKRAELGLAEGVQLVLFVGSGFRTKGLDRALRALATLPAERRERIVFRVVGQDKAAPYQRLAESLGLQNQVAFLGGRNDIPELLWAADALLHPAYRENTGTVLLEAMVAGVPVVTTAACGYAHYVTDWELGRVLVDPEPAALAEALAAVLDAPAAAWRERAAAFAAGDDIFAMPERAAEAIETVGRARSGGGS